MRLGRAWVPILMIGVLTSITACTTPVGRPAPSATPTMTSSVRLQCTDGVADSGPILPGLLLTEGVGSALRATMSSLPKAVNVGIWAPSNEWSFRKAPLFLAAGSGTVTLEVPDDGKQYLVWTSADVWTGDHASAEARRVWTTPKVIAEACKGTTISFYGGLLILEPAHCFPLTIVRTGHPAETQVIRGNGKTCPEPE
jgi:hypothetical protein